MQKVLSSEQIRLADAATIKNEGISSLNLMDRAATKAFEAILKKVNAEENSFVVFCGMGNNGGDGLVIARLLADVGYNVRIYILQFKEKGSQDFEENLQRLKSYSIEINYINDRQLNCSLKNSEIIIDAIFGSGLNRSIQGFTKNTIQQINSSNCKVFSLDIPSGLFAEDNSSNDRNAIIKASYSLTFESPKLAFFFPENDAFVGNWEVVPIGLDQNFIASQNCSNYFVGISDAAKLLKERNSFDHKGKFGHSLIYAGSFGKIGAAILSARACLRAGTGLLSMRIPLCGYEIMQKAVVEAMIESDDEEKYLGNFLKSENFSAVGIGPGIGKEERTEKLLRQILQNSTQALLLDADALNILSENKTWLSFLHSSTILTPHPKEFMRLAGKWNNDFERYEMHRNFALKYQVYILLKGKFSALACPSGEVYFNSSGNPGMATAGSGDVLSGILVALLSQNYSLKEAGILGMYLHGLAGDLAAIRKSQIAMIASDIIDFIPKAILEMEKVRSKA